MLLNRQYKNVRSVKEATGDLERMAKTRKLIGKDFDILSGDDDKTHEMMTSQDILATGVVSVTSNVVPGAVAEMTRAVLGGERERAEMLRTALDPLFKIVTIKTTESYEGFTVPCRFRNPLPIKTLMNGLGMPAGPCRQPLGKMTPKGIAVVRQAIRTVYERSPELLAPIEAHYKVKPGDRIADEVESPVEQLGRFLQVDDVDPVTGAEDIRLHLRVPATGLVSEVDTGLQQGLH